MTDKPADLRIALVTDRSSLRRFVAAERHFYADDPNWIAPLQFERMMHLDPSRNPFFRHAEVAYWLAMRGERTVGRISAQVNHAHLRHYDDATGHFGFIDGEDDAEVFAALTGAAETWLRQKGMTRVCGPFTLSINDETGLLISGFEYPPYVMMGHARRWYASRLEEQGYAKAKDVLAYRFDMDTPMPDNVRTFIERSLNAQRARYRPVDFRRFNQEIETIVDIFNDAWSRNWGFVAFTTDEVRHLASTLRPLIRPENVCVAELDGEPAAMAVSLPNINRAIADLDGRLLPFGWAKLLWRLKVRGISSVRIPLMGVRRRHHGSTLGTGLALGVMQTLRDWQDRLGTREAELSWVLEDNRAIRRMAEIAGGKAYKTYRIYQKALT